MFFFVYFIPVLTVIITNIKVYYAVCREWDLPLLSDTFRYAIKIRRRGRDNAFNFDEPHLPRRLRAERQIGQTIILVVGKSAFLRKRQLLVVLLSAVFTKARWYLCSRSRFWDQTERSFYQNSQRLTLPWSTRSYSNRLCFFQRVSFSPGLPMPWWFACVSFSVLFNYHQSLPLYRRLFPKLVFCKSLSYVDISLRKYISHCLDGIHLSMLFAIRTFANTCHSFEDFVIIIVVFVEVCIRSWAFLAHSDYIWYLARQTISTSFTIPPWSLLRGLSHPKPVVHWQSTYMYFIMRSIFLSHGRITYQWRMD